MAIIQSIDKNGRGRHFKVGDDILSFNDMPMTDILDYLFADGQSVVDITYIRKGRKKHKTIKKAEYESLGFNFDKCYNLSTTRCKNKCKFCFVDQLPKDKNLRDTLFVKDDDYRLSFACGNYVTLTNVTDNDIDRIIKYHLSPMYISVHAYDSEVRKNLVANPNTIHLIDYIKRMAEAGIVMHTQVVMCEGINDGKVLEETARELLRFYPNVKSLAVVPVGLTDHRQGLYPLSPISKECANATIDLIEGINAEANGFCWCSDEMYQIADRKIPSVDYYGDLEQIGNGVGMLAEFKADFDDCVTTLIGLTITKKFGLVTGKSFAPILADYMKTLTEIISGLEVRVFGIENEFFGKNVTVAGLVVGSDIINQIKDKIGDLDYIILPNTMFKEFETVMLDGTTIEKLQQELDKKVLISAPTASGLLDTLRSEL